MSFWFEGTQQKDTRFPNSRQWRIFWFFGKTLKIWNNLKILHCGEFGNLVSFWFEGTTQKDTRFPNSRQWRIFWFFGKTLKIGNNLKNVHPTEGSYGDWRRICQISPKPINNPTRNFGSPNLKMSQNLVSYKVRKDLDGDIYGSRAHTMTL